MKIYNISHTQLDTVKLQNKPTKQNFACSPIKRNQPQEQASKILANYNKANISFGANYKVVQKFADELHLKINNLPKNTETIAVKVVQTLGTVATALFLTPSEDERQNLTKNNSEVLLPIPLLNRKNNEYYDKVSIEDVVFIGKENTELLSDKIDIEISPKTAFNYEQPKSFFVNGNEVKTSQDFKTVISANAKGKIKVFSSSNEDNLLQIMNYKGEEDIIVLLEDPSALFNLMFAVTDPNFILPNKIKGILAQTPPIKIPTRVFDGLSHTAARMKNIPFVILGQDELNHIKEFAKENPYLKVKVNTLELKVDKAEKKQTNEIAKIVVPKLDTSNPLCSIDTDKKFDVREYGVKATNLAELSRLSIETGAKTPRFTAIPAGFFDLTKQANSENYTKSGGFLETVKTIDETYNGILLLEKQLERLEEIDEKNDFDKKNIKNKKASIASENEALKNSINKMREIIKQDMEIPDDLFQSVIIKLGQTVGKSEKEIKEYLKNYEKYPNEEYKKIKNLEGDALKTFKSKLEQDGFYNDGRYKVKIGTPTLEEFLGFKLSARSSFPNIEDLDIIATQGMFESVGGVKSLGELYDAILEVWASKWGIVATQRRLEYGIPHDDVQPAVVVQEYIDNQDYVFTAYTQKNNDPNIMQIELSQGLTCDMAGDGYIFTFDRTSNEIKRILMANKGRKKIAKDIDVADKANLNYTETDYSQDPLNRSHNEYQPSIEKIVNILMLIEKHFGGKAQDIEGGIKFVKDKNGNFDIETTLWQTRDVQMQKD